MKEYACLVGLDEHEGAEICERLAALDIAAFHRVTLPSIVVQDSQLWVETESRPRYVPVNKIVYHSIYENDLDFMTGLAFWDGPCLPDARAMLDLRLKLPGLVRAVAHTRFPYPRGFISANTVFRSEAQQELVAKWGNWHCGENKERFTDSWQGSEAAVIEPFIEGQAVRLMMIGNTYWQIRLEGSDWLKSLHAPNADFMEVDAELLEDTRHLKEVFGLQVIGNDYIIGHDGRKYLLEVNHIPNVSRFPEIWQAYRDYTVAWISQN
jgi:hypothetical protein